MASSFLNIASTQFAFKKPSNGELTSRQIRPFQVKCKLDSEHKTPNKTGVSVSRRDAMLCLTALSVTTGISMSSPETAEARMSRAEMKRKIMEKLQQLKEKAGLSKKDDGSSKKGNTSSSPPSAKKDSNPPPPLEPAPFPLPNPPVTGQSVVEVTLS